MSNEQSSRARPLQKTANTGALGLVLILVAVAVAAGLYFATADKAEKPVKAEKEQPAAEPVSPFADMPPEQRPAKKSKSE
jgi:cell division protein FtsN